MKLIATLICCLFFLALSPAHADAKDKARNLCVEAVDKCEKACGNKAGAKKEEVKATDEECLKSCLSSNIKPIFLPKLKYCIAGRISCKMSICPRLSECICYSLLWPSGNPPGHPPPK